MDHVRSALPVLFSPGESHELRRLRPFGSEIVSIDDPAHALRVAENLSNGRLYYSLNPVRPDSKSARAETVTRRKFFLVDIDPACPVDTCATQEEKDHAQDLASQVWLYTDSLGWSGPIIIDSGNGFHLLYRVDLPNDKLTHNLFKAALEGLAKRLDTPDAIIDRKTHDSPRIAKLPGTWSRKGPDTPERPHRMARIIFAPTQTDPIPPELIRLASDGPDRDPVSPFAMRASDGGQDKTKYVRAAIEAECGRLSMAPHGERNDQLNKSALVLGTLSDWPEMNEAEARDALLKTALLIGLPEREAIKTIRSGWNKGRTNPRERPVEPHANGKAPPKSGPYIQYANRVITRKVQWLDPGRIPLGKMTTFAGETGLGKTFTVCDIAARVTIGGLIPFGKGACYPRGEVLFISAEDDAEDTIVPRFEELGGDKSKLALLHPDYEEKFHLSSLELLNNCLGEMGKDVKLVIIDPPTSYMGRVNDHHNAELRGLLAPLRRWCRDRMVSLIFITHVNKPGANNVEAISRVMGGIGWVSAVRSAMIFCPDPYDETQCLYLPLKANNSAKAKGLAYRIVPTHDGNARIAWTGESTISANQGMAGPLPKLTAAKSAVDWIIRKFREKREWRSDELKESSKEDGVSGHSLFKSEEVKKLPIVKTKVTNAEGLTYWVWIAKYGWPPEQQEDEGKLESCNVSPIDIEGSQLSEDTESNRKDGKLDEEATFQLSDPDKGSTESSNPHTGQEVNGQLSMFPEDIDREKNPENQRQDSQDIPLPKPPNYPGEWEFYKGEGNKGKPTS